MSDVRPPVSAMSVDAFTAALASDTPTPGGGSASAVAAAMAASLTAMVARLSQERPRYAEHAELYVEAVAGSDAARSHFLRLADDDAGAYEAYRAARRMPHASLEESAARDSASRAAARGATEVPLALVQACHQQADLIERLAGRSNVAATSDLDVAALLLDGAAHGAAANVLINLPAVEDADYAAAVSVEVEERLHLIEGAAARTHERIGSGARRGPEA